MLSELKGSISEEEEAEEDDGEISDGASTSSDRSYRPKKKRKTIHGLEHVSLFHLPNPQQGCLEKDVIVS